MRKEEIEKLLAYIVNEESRLESEVIELQNRIRFRRISVNDCFELALTLQRLDDFRDFSLIVLRLLDLGQDVYRSADQAREDADI